MDDLSFGAGVGLRIKQARKSAGLSKFGLARKVGVSHTSIANWEAGSAGEIRVRHLAAVATATGCGLLRLFLGECPAGEPPSECVEESFSGSVNPKDLLGIEKSNPLATQEGGTHYKTMKIQPIEFTEVNCLNACQVKAVKYVSRHKSKHGAEDLAKASHCLSLLLQLARQHGFKGWFGRLLRGDDYLISPGILIRHRLGLPCIFSQDYVAANRLSEREGEIIGLVSDEPTVVNIERAIACIDALCAAEYGGGKQE